MLHYTYYKFFILPQNKNETNCSIKFSILEIIVIIYKGQKCLLLELISTNRMLLLQLQLILNWCFGQININKTCPKKQQLQ